MPADLLLPSRLLAGGGPSTPDQRVLRVLGAPPIGQFDPHFTAIMDEVSALARSVFLTDNRRCFAVSGTAAAGMEAFISTLVEDGDTLAIGGGPRFAAEQAIVATRYGARVVGIDQVGPGVKLVIAPLIDPETGTLLAVPHLVDTCRAVGARLLVDGTLALGVRELRVDAWGIDACAAGVDHGVGAPSGMALVTYQPEVEAMMLARRIPPRTSYLDLLQLQAYWSPERLNHHTAPTSLVYGLREAMRLIDDEGLESRWSRHAHIGQALQAGLEGLGLSVSGTLPYAFVRPPRHTDEATLRRRLLDEFGVYVRVVADGVWRVGLLGADALHDSLQRVLTAMENVVCEPA